MPIKLYGAMMKEEIAAYKFNYSMRGLKKYGSLILMRRENGNIHNL